MIGRRWAAGLAGLVSLLTSVLSLILAANIGRAWMWRLGWGAAVAGAVLTVAQVLIASKAEAGSPGQRADGTGGSVPRVIRQLQLLSRGDNNVTTFISHAPDRVEAPREKSVRTDYLGRLEDRVRIRLAEGLDHEVGRVLGGEHTIPFALRSRPLCVASSSFAPFGLGDRVLPPDVTVAQAFKDAHRSVLILGDSGVGKSTALLRLVAEYISEAGAHADPGESGPVPVWLSLRSWPLDSAETFEAWLLEALVREHWVPRSVAREWLDAERLVLFLDGLGEMDRPQQRSCATAINVFLRSHAPRGIAICGRGIAEGRGPDAGMLPLNAALEILPTGESDARAFLRSLGPRCVGLLEVFDSDPATRAVLSTPFILCAVALAYADRSFSAIAGGATRGRYEILDAYVDRVLERADLQDAREYQSLRPTLKRRLSYLAERMVANDWYEIWEVPQAALLPGAFLRRVMKIGPPLLTGLVAAAAFGMASYLCVGKVIGLTVSGIILTGFLALYIIGIGGGLPRLAHMPDTRLTFSTTQMRSGAALARNIPVAFLALAVGAYLATAVPWNPAVPWHAVSLGTQIVFWLCVTGALLAAPAAILSGGIGSAPVVAAPPPDYLQSPVHEDLRLGPQLLYLMVDSAKAFAKWALIFLPMLLVLRCAVYWVAVSKYDELAALPDADGFLGRVRLDGASFVHVLFAESPFGTVLGRPVVWPLLAAGALAMAVAVLNAAFLGALSIEWTVTQFILIRQDMIDTDFAGFLQYAARLPLLRMAGGGYEFYHAQLRDYFAARHSGHSPDRHK